MGIKFQNEFVGVTKPQHFNPGPLQFKIHSFHLNPQSLNLFQYQLKTLKPKDSSKSDMGKVQGTVYPGAVPPAGSMQNQYK